jgi:PAS domain-containing protein
VLAYREELEHWLANQAVAQPVTELSDAHFRAMFYASKLPIDVLDDERRIVDANAAVLHLFGKKDKNEILGRHVDEFIEKPAAEIAKEWQEFLDRGFLEGTLFVQAPDRPKVLVMYTVRRFLPGLNMAISRVIESPDDPVWLTANEKLKTLQSAAHAD